MLFPKGSLMYRDPEIHARSLGISLKDYSEASRKMNEAARRDGPEGTYEQYVSVIKSLPQNEMVAYVRWNRLDRRMSKIFDWNGIKEGVECRDAKNV